MLEEIFDLENSSFIAYKNSGDETGISLPYKLISPDTMELLFDVRDNTCLEFNTMLSENFRNKGEQLILKISTDSIINTETNEDDQMMMFRSQIVSYNESGEELKEKEDEKMLCPDCDMTDDTFVLNIGDRQNIDAFNIDVWGTINGSSLNSNRKCILRLQLQSYKLNDNLNRLGHKTLKKVQN